MNDELSGLARLLGLEACATVVESFRVLPPAAAPDAALAQTAASDGQIALAQLVRRGLDPSRVALLRTAFAPDPLACGLLAWDVLNGALLPRDAPLEALRRDARAIEPLLARPGRAYINMSTVREEIDRAPAAGPRILPLLARLGAVGLDPANASPDTLEGARNVSRILHRSHLSTMASFFLADLVIRHQYAPALPDLVEVLLDQEAPDVEPWLQKSDQPSIELLTYARVRTLNNNEDWKSALAFADLHRDTFATADLPPDKAALINPRPTLAYAEACLRNGRSTVSNEHVAAITNLENPWRYAFRVLLMYGATRINDRRFATLLEAYLQNFGNDLHVWYDSVALAGAGCRWGGAITALLVREAFALPHDAAVWTAIALILGDGDAADAAYAEVKARIVAQATLS